MMEVNVMRITMKTKQNRYITICNPLGHGTWNDKGVGCLYDYHNTEYNTIII